MTDSTPISPAALSQTIVQLAIEIADDCARCDIECYCAFHEFGAHVWYDTRHTAQQMGDDFSVSIEKALRYLDLRGLATHHPAQHHLVRF